MIRNFAGQWLQLRDLEGIAIDARTVLARDQGTRQGMQDQLAAFRQRQLAFQQQGARGSFRKSAPYGNHARARRRSRLRNRRRSPTFAGGSRGNLRNNPQRQQQFRRFSGCRAGRPASLGHAQRAEMVFESIVRDKRDLADLARCNYTYVTKSSQALWYPNVTGTECAASSLLAKACAAAC